MTNKFVEFLFAMKILASPLIISFVIGFVLRLYLGGEKGDIALLVTFLAGFVVGMFILKSIRKHTTFSEFDSRIMASPDLDEAVKEK